MPHNAHERRVDDALVAALAAPETSRRLRAALEAGKHPMPERVEALVQRCAVETDFYVRDMLTWALTRHDPRDTIEPIVGELASPIAQARAQALHTLSKIGEPRVFAAIPWMLLHDADDEVARAAWRTVVGLAPRQSQVALAEALATEFGRGGRDVQLSLSRALVALGEAALPVIERARADRDDVVAAHAIATELLMADPDQGFDAAIAEARRALALQAMPQERE